MGRRFGSKKRNKTISTTDDSQTYKKSRKIGQDSCPICAPFEGENAGARGRRPKEDKHKNKNRETIRIS